MPSLSALYGLRWADLETMPKDELDEYLWQLPEVHAAINGR